MPPHEHGADGACEDTPLHRLRPFGSGLHRRPVAFVKAGEAPSATPPNSLPGPAVSDLYLSIVMGASDTPRPNTPLPPGTSGSVNTSLACNVCRLPLPASSAAAAHETCLVHQVALDHSHPPSALDRRSRGLAVLTAQGWDPDSRRGLGAEQQGVAFPLKTKARPERQGLGDGETQKESYKHGKKRKLAPPPQPPRRTLGAKQIRRLEQEQQRRGERLREQIMYSRDLDKYLHGDAEG